MSRSSLWLNPVAALFALYASFSGGWAAGYPERPIRLVVPYSVGGTADLSARLLGAKLTEALRQQVVIDNRGGGGSTIGTALVARANPDGYTLLLNNIGLAVNETLRPERTYNALKDLAPISRIGATPSVLVVNNALPVKSLAEFLALARSQPGRIAFGSAGVGSSTHLAMSYFQSLAKISLHHVPYQGGGPAVRDAIAGHVQCTLSPVPTVYGHLKAGRLRALAITSSKRFATLPDLPTIAESGVPGFEFSTWFGLLAPAGTPKAIIARLNETAVSALHSADLREKFLSQGLEPQPSTPEEFGDFLRSEIRKWREVIESAGIQPQL